MTATSPMPNPVSRSRAATDQESGLRWAALGPALAGLLAVPFLINQNTWFEWANALWLVKLQTAYVQLHGVPTFFINAPQQVLYPVHLFYAGPLFSVLAYPSAVFGAWPVFAAATVAAFIGLATGIYLVATALGVPRPYAVAPGLLFATTPYVVSDLYGRGAWAELVALAALSMTLGAAATLLAGPTRPTRPFIALVASSFILGGSHNITMMWTAIAAIPFVALLAMQLRLGRAKVVRRGLAVAAAAGLGMALCGCFLLPNLVLARDTLIGQSSTEVMSLATNHQFETPSVVFSPLLTQPTSRAPSDFHTQTATVALIWILLVLAGHGRKLHRPTLLALAGTGFLAALFAILIFNPDWWSHLPSFLWATQFTFRLIPFLTLSVLLAVVCLLRHPLVRSSRWAMACLAIAVGWQASLAGYQSVTARGRAIAPYRSATASQVTTGRVPDSFDGAGFAQPYQFKLISGTHLPRPKDVALAPAILTRPPAAISLSGPQRPGTLIATNAVYSPLITARGDAQIAGRDEHGYIVLRILGHESAHWTATLVGACPLCLSAISLRDRYSPLAAGQALTVFSMAALLALWVWQRVLRPRVAEHRGRRYEGQHFVQSRAHGEPS